MADKELTKDEITELILSEMLEHDLIGIPFSWSQSKRYLGYTTYGFDKETMSHYPKAISLSESFFNGLEDKWEMVDTVFHELAHAVAVKEFNSIGHGPIWKRIAKTLGANPLAKCGQDVKIDYTKTGHKYIATCPDCDYSFGFSRMGKIWQRQGYICPQCKKTLIVEKNY